MSIMSRYVTVSETKDRYDNVKKTSEVNSFAVVRDAGIVFAALIGLMFLWPFSSVPTGSRGVVTQFGAIESIHNEGLVILPPWKKISMFSIRAEAANIDNAPGATSDTQPVHTSLTVRYSIKPDKVSEVFEKYSHSGDLSSYVNTATMEAFKAVTAKYEATQLIAQRQKVSDDLKEVLSRNLAIYGAEVIKIDMRDFKFQDSYMAAINAKVEQEQLRLAAENKLKTVEAEQKQKVAIAEAEANAVKAKADGDAYATITNAKANAEETKLNANAQAEALKVQSAALVAQGPGILELKRINVEQTRAEKWDGKLPEAVYGSAPIPFLPNAGVK